MRRLLLITTTIVYLCLVACNREGDKLANTPPETNISVDAINLTGEDRLSSIVRLSWNGRDKDGYVIGYEFSFDNNNWTFTTKQDSIFSFDLEGGSDTTDIDFYIRAIDNDSITDPTPDYLKIPIKNTPPEVAFEEASMPHNSSLLVFTFRWDGQDQDGDNTIQQAYIKINNGDWTEFDRNQKMISLVPSDPEVNGQQLADVYYNTDRDKENFQVNGFINNDSNTVYIKLVDLAGAESNIDTSSTIFIAPQTGHNLYVTGNSTNITALYTDILDQVDPSYDMVDYGGNSQPAFWNPTFYYQLMHYDALIWTSPSQLTTNPYNGQKDLLLNFAAPILEEYNNIDGKTLVITEISGNFDFSPIYSVMPIDSVSSSGGQALMTTDSSLVATETGYVDLSPTAVLLNMSPFYMSPGAVEIYEGQFQPSQGWEGPRTAAAKMANAGNTYQVFFSVPLYQFNANPNDLNTVFAKILNDEFNW